MYLPNAVATAPAANKIPKPFNIGAATIALALLIVVVFATQVVKALVTIPTKLPPDTVTKVSPAILPVPAQVPVKTCFNVVPCSVGFATIADNVSLAAAGSLNIPPCCVIISTPVCALPPPKVLSAATTSFGLDDGLKLRPIVLFII